MLRFKLILADYIKHHRMEGALFMFILMPEGWKNIKDRLIHLLQPKNVNHVEINRIYNSMMGLALALITH